MLRALLCLAALAAAAGERSAQSRADAWLSMHNPDEAGMNDLKTQDPNAFAIVQALLAKRSLGLLDPKHPSSSFTEGAPKEHKTFKEEAEAAGLTADGSSNSAAPEMSELATKSSVPYPSISASATNPYPEVLASHRSGFDFHPSQDDDDKLVQGVLGQVAELKGAAPAMPATSESSAPAEPASLSLSGVASDLMARMDRSTRGRRSSEFMSSAAAAPTQPTPSLSWGNAYAGTSERASYSAPRTQPAMEAPQAHPQASLASENSYLKGIKFAKQVINDVKAEQKPQNEQNSYLAGIDFTPELAQMHGKSDEPKPEASMTQQNSYLSNIDFTPELKQYGKSAGAGFVAPAPVTPKAEAAMSQENSYLKGIDFSHVQKTHPKPEAAASQENSYLKGIDFSSTVDDALDFTSHAAKELAMSSFHKQMSQYRTEKPSVHAAAAAQVSNGLGDSYTKDLSAAKSRGWQRAMEATSWGSEDERPKAQYLQQGTEDDDDTENSQEKDSKRLDKWLNSGSKTALAVQNAVAKGTGSWNAGNAYLMDLS